MLEHVGGPFSASTPLHSGGREEETTSCSIVKVRLRGRDRFRRSVEATREDRNRSEQPGSRLRLGADLLSRPPKGAPGRTRPSSAGFEGRRGRSAPISATCSKRCGVDLTDFAAFERAPKSVAAVVECLGWAARLGLDRSERPWIGPRIGRVHRRGPLMVGSTWRGPSRGTPDDLSGQTCPRSKGFDGGSNRSRRGRSALIPGCTPALRSRRAAWTRP
jgi:hypothetical protein